MNAPIRSPILEAVSLPERGLVAAYLLDPDRLDDTDRYRLAHTLGQRFNVPFSRADTELEENDVPILADGVTVGTDCCDYLPAGHVDRPSPPSYVDALARELHALGQDPQRVALDISKLDALLLMGILQVAVKHPGVVAQPLVVAIDAARKLQEATCPPGSARERLALGGWVGR